MKTAAAATNTSGPWRPTDTMSAARTHSLPATSAPTEPSSRTNLRGTCVLCIDRSLLLFNISFNITSSHLKCCYQLNYQNKLHLHIHCCIIRFIKLTSLIFNHPTDNHTIIKLLLQNASTKIVLDLGMDLNKLFISFISTCPVSCVVLNYWL